MTCLKRTATLAAILAVFAAPVSSAPPPGEVCSVILGGIVDANGDGLDDRRVPTSVRTSNAVISCVSEVGRDSIILGATVENSSVGRNARILAGSTVRRAVAGNNLRVSIDVFISTDSDRGSLVIGNGVTFREGSSARDSDVRTIQRIGNGVIYDTGAVTQGVSIGARSFIGSNANLAQATLGSDVNIGANVSLFRGTIGSGTTIRRDVDLGIITTIGNGVTIGRNTEVGNFVEIGNNTVIRRGVTIGNSAEIGEGVVINRRATIAEGAVVPDFTVVAAGSTFE